MKYNILLISFIVLIFIEGFSQEKKYIYYFDQKLHITSQSKSVFTGTGLMDNGLLELRCYNKINTGPFMIAHFTDSTLSLLKGLFQLYHANGYLQSQGKYAETKEDGLWQQWDTVGHLTDSSIFENGEKILDASFTYNESGNLILRTIDDLKNIKLNRTYYDGKGIVTGDDTFSETGLVKNYHDSVTDDKVFMAMEIKASFPGGEHAWTQYITNEIRKNIDAITDEGRSGTCRVRFIVDREGNVLNIEALSMQGTTLAKVAMNAIVKGPKWIPARQNGRVVKSYREQPVAFTLESR